MSGFDNDSSMFAPIAGPFAPSSTGATAATRYVGGTVSGAPVSGTFKVGDFVIDQTGLIWINTVAGSPGTWVLAQSGAYEAPFIIVPPGALLATAAIAHGAINRAYGMRFGVLAARSYRYARFNIGVQSGNIQVCVVKRDAGTLATFTRVMDSGVIACPAAAAIRLDLGATVLQPGDYWLCVWADNTTVTMTSLNGSPATAYAGLAARFNAIVGGIAGTGTWDTADSGWMSGLTLEATTP